MKKIVVIDDDLDVLEVISFALETDGFKVVCFTNGKEGLEGLSEMNEVPGLIIVDYLMPEMNGLEFITAIRGLPHLKNIPLAISSAMGKLEPAFGKLPNAILLQKPMELEDLLKVAREHCVSHHKSS